MTPDRKIRILALCDSPTTATGFAQVSKNILNGLVATGKYEVDVVGINFFGNYYKREDYPYNIYPAMPQGYQDMYGRGRIMNALSGNEEKNGLVGPWDILFTIQDPFIIEGLGGQFAFAEQVTVTKELWKRTVPPDQWFKWIGYFPVDSTLKENWVTKAIALPDYPVAYCEWGKSEMLKFDRAEFDTFFKFKTEKEQIDKRVKLVTPSLKDRLSVIHHGVDTQVFHPLAEEEIKQFKKDYFGDLLKDDTCLVINVSRNQPRKDICRTLAVFAEFKKRVPNSHLYLHCKTEDVGGSVPEMARNFGLTSKDFSLPKEFDAGIGYPPEVINRLYNAADMCITTTLGEGWGFITTEAMATKTPIVAPYITSMLDIFGGNGLAYDTAALEVDEVIRGIPVRAGATNSEWICMGIEDNERVRPLTNVNDMVEKMVWVHEHQEIVKKIVDRAYDWVLEQNWVQIVSKWDELFMRAFSQLHVERQMALQLDKTGRNDPCPCGSGQKFKKCHGSGDRMDKVKDWLDQPDYSKR